jgi:hypothetical protein
VREREPTQIQMLSARTPRASIARIDVGIESKRHQVLSSQRRIRNHEDSLANNCCCGGPFDIMSPCNGGHGAMSNLHRRRQRRENKERGRVSLYGKTQLRQLIITDRSHSQG